MSAQDNKLYPNLCATLRSVTVEHSTVLFPAKSQAISLVSKERSYSVGLCSSNDKLKASIAPTLIRGTPCALLDCF